MAGEHETVTIDLKGLNLSVDEFASVQAALHQTALMEISKLPAFKTGISIKPNLQDPFILGIVIEKLPHP